MAKILNSNFLKVFFYTQADTYSYQQADNEEIIIMNHVCIKQQIYNL